MRLPVVALPNRPQDRKSHKMQAHRGSEGILPERNPGQPSERKVKPKALWTTAFPDQVSIKRKLQRYRYRVKAVMFKKANPVCQVCWIARSTEVHHTAGRLSDRLLDDTKWITTCAACHRWIHDNPMLARKKGWLAKHGDWNKKK